MIYVIFLFSQLRFVKLLKADYDTSERLKLVSGDFATVKVCRSLYFCLVIQPIYCFMNLFFLVMHGSSASVTKKNNLIYTFFKKIPLYVLY